jgi:hypothetical protein
LNDRCAKEFRAEVKQKALPSYFKLLDYITWSFLFFIQKPEKNGHKGIRLLMYMETVCCNN